MTATKVLLLGPPGAGKGTQSDRIAETFDLEHIATGDVLRERKHMETEYGTPASYMDEGELVPDPVINEIVEAALADADGFVLDGYPRNMDQAEYLEDAADLDAILYIEVSEEESVRRLTGRRVCEDCGRNFHVEFEPPEAEGVCDACGGELYQRDDDTEGTVRERLAVYEESTAPVVEHYRSTDAFRRIDGERSPDAVWADVEAAVADAD